MHAPGDKTCSPRTQQNRHHTQNTFQTFHSRCYFCTLLHTHPLHFTPSYHPVRSRRWFFGRSCRAHCSQASATLYPSPPSLLTPTHTDPSGRAFTPSLAHQLFRLLPGHMHARAHQPSYSHIQYSHTPHRERKVLMHRVVLLEHEQPSPVVE